MIYMNGIEINIFWLIFIQHFISTQEGCACGVRVIVGVIEGRVMAVSVTLTQ